MPTLSAAGNGRYDVDAEFTRVHALGNLKIVASRLGVLAPPLDSLGTVTLRARFDLDHSGHAARIDGLSLSVSGDRLAADIQSLQPFVFDEGTGEMNALDPRGDWLDASIRGLPLAWFSGLAGGRTIAGGDATGEFVVRAADFDARLIKLDQQAIHGHLQNFCKLRNCYFGHELNPRPPSMARFEPGRACCHD